MDTSGWPQARHSAAASGWAVTRTARVSCRPRSQRGFRAGREPARYEVPANWRAAAPARPGSGAQKGASWAKSAAIRIRPFMRRPALECEQAPYRWFVAGIAAEPVHRLGGVGDQAARTNRASDGAQT